MATSTEVVQRFVEAFVSAWPAADAARVAALFTEDASYHNGPLEPVHGRRAIETTLAEFMAMGGEVAVDMVHLLAGEHVVMTERIDHFVIGGKTFSLPVMGVFEIDNGQIRAWRDYFDLAQSTSPRGRLPS
jgi:limonene-1,2-epoxide hydrolase